MGDYSKKHIPQTYGEEKQISKMSTKDIQRAVVEKEKIKRTNPKLYHETYCGFGFGK